MAETIKIKAHDNHLDTLKDIREKLSEQFGTTQTPDGYRVPDTSNGAVQQLTVWFNKEYIRALIARPWNDDPARKGWEQAFERVVTETKDADPDAQYPHNHWFWNTALLKLAIYLQSEKGKPSPMSMLIDSFEESVSDRIQDAREFIEDAGEAASDVVSTVSRAAKAVSEVGERAWSSAKTVAIIGGGLIGAAIIVPPIIRAMRD